MGKKKEYGFIFIKITYVIVFLCLITAIIDIWATIDLVKVVFTEMVLILLSLGLALVSFLKK